MGRSGQSLVYAFVFTSCLPQAPSCIHSKLTVCSKSSIAPSSGTNLHPRTTCVTSLPTMPWVLGLTPPSPAPGLQTQAGGPATPNAVPAKSVLLKQRVWVTSGSRQGSRNGWFVFNRQPGHLERPYSLWTRWWVVWQLPPGKTKPCCFHVPALPAGIRFLIRKKY